MRNRSETKLVILKLLSLSFQARYMPGQALLADLNTVPCLSLKASTLQAPLDLSSIMIGRRLPKEAPDTLFGPRPVRLAHRGQVA